MDNRERFFTALNLHQSDRVPYFDWFNYESIVNVAKVLFGDAFPVRDPNDEPSGFPVTDETYEYLDLQFKIIRKLDLDATIAWGLAGYEPVPGKKDIIKDSYGIIYQTSQHGEPIPIEGPVKDPSDLSKIASIEPNPEDFKLLEYFKEQVPERVLLFDCKEPFCRSWFFVGSMEKFLPLYILEPEFCLQLARIATDLIKKEIEIAIDKGAEVIFLGGDYAFRENTLMSRDQFNKFVNVFNFEICELAHKRGVPIIKHSDGNIWPILDDLIEAGFDGIHPIEPQAMDIMEVKKHLLGKACVLGNIDCAELLVTGKKEEVILTVKDTIQKVAPGGGYMLTSSNSIHPGCNGENVVAMFEAAKAYGSYSSSKKHT